MKVGWELGIAIGLIKPLSNKAQKRCSVFFGHECLVAQRRKDDSTISLNLDSITVIYPARRTARFELGVLVVRCVIM